MVVYSYQEDWYNCGVAWIYFRASVVIIPGEGVYIRCDTGMMISHNDKGCMGKTQEN